MSTTLPGADPGKGIGISALPDIGGRAPCAVSWPHGCGLLLLGGEELGLQVRRARQQHDPCQVMAKFCEGLSSVAMMLQCFILT